jgi:uncharacterized protein (TIGR00725 family)
MEKKSVLQVAVVGGSEADAETLALAGETGGVIAGLGAIVVCGGLGGVMAAVARGAKLHNGLTVGILPSYAHSEKNDFIDVTIPTGLGHARNVLVASAGDVVVALPGSHGTRAEISIALVLGRPVYGLRGWGDIPGVHPIARPEELKTILLPKI